MVPYNWPFHIRTHKRALFSKIAREICFFIPVSNMHPNAKRFTWALLHLLVKVTWPWSGRICPREFLTGRKTSCQKLLRPVKNSPFWPDQGHVTLTHRCRRAKGNHFLLFWVYSIWDSERFYILSFWHPSSIFYLFINNLRMHSMHISFRDPPMFYVSRTPHSTFLFLVSILPPLRISNGIHVALRCWSKIDKLLQQDPWSLYYFRSKSEEANPWIMLKIYRIVHIDAWHRASPPMVSIMLWTILGFNSSLLSVKPEATCKSKETFYINDSKIKINYDNYLLGGKGYGADIPGGPRGPCPPWWSGGAPTCPLWCCRDAQKCPPICLPPPPVPFFWIRLCYLIDLLRNGDPPSLAHFTK